MLAGSSGYIATYTQISSLEIRVFNTPASRPADQSFALAPSLSRAYDVHTNSDPHHDMVGGLAPRAIEPYRPRDSYWCRPHTRSRNCAKTRVCYGLSAAIGGTGSWRGIRRATRVQLGIHQLASPSSRIRAGTSSARMTVASRMIPAAMPIASGLTS